MHQPTVPTSTTGESRETQHQHQQHQQHQHHHFLSTIVAATHKRKHSRSHSTSSSFVRPKTSHSHHKEFRTNSPPPSSQAPGLPRYRSFQNLASHSQSKAGEAQSSSSIRSSSHRRGSDVAAAPSPPKPPPSQQRRAAHGLNTDSFIRVADAAGVRSEPFSDATTYANMISRQNTGGFSTSGPTGMSVMAPLQPPSPTLETITYQHIQEMASKRISTLDYLRKAHEGRVYWFNTLLFNKPDLNKMPSFDSRKLARRATNYLLLGLSLPTILDLNSANALEFLKTLNALLAEFESFQQIHPPDGSISSMSRGRFPQMFKRATATAGKGRRTSAASEIGLPMGNDGSDTKSIMSSTSSSGTTPNSSFPMSDHDLLPGEEYIYLLTPSLPFDPDFYETFATLCDVLIDCYTRLMSLVSSPRECSPQVAEMFTKADARVRKIIVAGVVKEFEDSSRLGVKSEVAGVGRVVLGGLM